MLIKTNDEAETVVFNERITNNRVFLNNATVGTKYEAQISVRVELGDYDGFSATHTGAIHKLGIILLLLLKIYILLIVFRVSKFWSRRNW